MMQFNINFVAAALLVSTSPVLSTKLTFFKGASCTGSVIDVSTGSKPGDCVLLSNGGSAKSIKYSDVPHQIKFFKSGGKHDKCTNGASLVRGAGSGCGTAPAGFNFESVKIL
ncbi:hypothetical protein B0H13DRAFT_1852953 [Mycena leptocephala]|nr:hypothetical protein B0H13DRAFT_1852953 [Mycena leptocephala]